jgi:hypothetical protein
MFYEYSNSANSKVPAILLILHALVLQIVIMVLGIVVNILSKAEEFVEEANEIKRLHERIVLRKFIYKNAC